MSECVCVCVCVCMHACVCMCMHVHLVGAWGFKTKEAGSNLHNSVVSIGAAHVLMEFPLLCRPSQCSLCASPSPQTSSATCSYLCSGSSLLQAPTSGCSMCGTQVLDMTLDVAIYYSVSCELSPLSFHKTCLSFHKTYLSVHKTYLRFHRTYLSFHKTYLSKMQVTVLLTVVFR